MSKRTFDRVAHEGEQMVAAELRRLPARTWPERCPDCHGAMEFDLRHGALQVSRQCVNIECGRRVTAQEVLK